MNDQRAKAWSKEPFRIFFNQAIVAGVLGVALWPLHFWGGMESYPGIPHVRVDRKSVV